MGIHRASANFPPDYSHGFLAEAFVSGSSVDFRRLQATQRGMALSGTVLLQEPTAKSHSNRAGHDGRQ